MDTNKRKTGLARLIEIAGTKRRLLIGAMLLAVITAIVQFVPIIAVYNILIELAEHALDPSLIDKAYIWLWSYIALGAFFAFGVLTFASLMLSHIAATNAASTKNGSFALGVLFPPGFGRTEENNERRRGAHRTVYCPPYP